MSILAAAPAFAVPRFVRDFLAWAGATIDGLGWPVVGAIAAGVIGAGALVIVWLRTRGQGRVHPDAEIDPRDLPPILFRPDAGRETRSPSPVPPRPPVPAGLPGSELLPRSPVQPAGPAKPAANGAAEPLLAGPAVGEGTLQLLPGRLEYVSGGNGQEIRFVRPPGEARFTFGRSPGPAHTHIQIRVPTVSRMHAYMRFEDGVWSIGNLSRTNRVVVNDNALDTDVERELEDGDKVEIGEVTLVFRAR